jgi:hypothetical protein
MSNESKLNWKGWLIIGILVAVGVYNEFTKDKNESAKTNSPVVVSNGLKDKQFGYVMSGASALISFTSESKCDIIYKISGVSNESNGTYLVENDQITFNWEGGKGPKSGKLIKNASAPWKIDVNGSTIYEEYVP